MGKDATRARVAARPFPLAAPGFAALLALAALTGPASAQVTPANPPPVVEAPATPDAAPSVAAPATTAPATTEVEPSPSLAPDTAAPTFPAPDSLAQIAADLSPWGMFLAADMVVKSVMIGLVLASLVTWTICLAKGVEILIAKARLRRALRAVLGARALGELADILGDGRDPAGLMVAAARHEVEASAPAIEAASPGGLLDRVASHLSRIEAHAGRRLTLGTGLLATIGATAPFVGLFGTVWGIMNSFIGISQSQTTNLAVVAPGIAEALLATALGLVAAIPAVVIYNHFARSVAAYRALLADTAAGIERLVSRDLDLERLAAPALRRAAE